MAVPTPARSRTIPNEPPPILWPPQATSAPTRAFTSSLTATRTTIARVPSPRTAPSRSSASGFPSRAAAKAKTRQIPNPTRSTTPSFRATTATVVPGRVQTAARTTANQLAKRQQSFDDLGDPLSGVTFCVVDLETTGASANTCAITEVGAARYLGGKCIGTLQTLVNPGVPIPPEIVYLTGITETMVGPAPKISAVLPSLLEFIGDAVIVGHNVRFDLSFLNAALRANHYPTLSNRVLDTCGLARRLVRQEVPNCKLGTLSAHFGFHHQPTHRALDDVKATADLLHLLFERAAGFGVLGLTDLAELPAINRHPQAAKLCLTNDLPRCPGVYVFRDQSNKVIYVGKATNLRSRVRSYFSSDDRRKIGAMLEILHRIDHIPCALTIEAEVLEIRLIQRFLPRFNRQAKLHTNYVYLRITGDGPSAKIVVSKDAGGVNDATYLGPFSSTSAARLAASALKTAIAANPDCWRDELLLTPEAALIRLFSTMTDAANSEKFEYAAQVRDGAGVLARALTRQRTVGALSAAGRIELHTGQNRLLVIDGRLRFTDPDAPNPAATSQPKTVRVTATKRNVAPEQKPAVARHSSALPLPPATATVDEMACVVRYLERCSRSVTVSFAEHGLALPAQRFPKFVPTGEACGPNHDEDDLLARGAVRVSASRRARKPNFNESRPLPLRA
jgi:DNA polymerase III subunit epsilon